MNRKTALLCIPMLLAAFIVSEADAQGRRGRGRGDGPRKQREDNAPKVGDSAPTFTLKAHDGKSETSLAEFKGEKPVVLFFGSYT